MKNKHWISKPASYLGLSFFLTDIAANLRQLGLKWGVKKLAKFTHEMPSSAVSWNLCLSLLLTKYLASKHNILQQNTFYISDSLKTIKIYMCNLKRNDNEQRFKHHSSISKSVSLELSRVKMSSKLSSLLISNWNNYYYTHCIFSLDFTNNCLARLAVW